MKKILKWIAGIMLFTASILLLVLLLITYTAYHPAKREVLFTNSNATSLPSDTLRLLTWNIGYAGLDSTMDFFFDGGAKTRQTQEQTQANLQAIGNFLNANSTNIDIFLLQEVDRDAHRSYGIDELTELSHTLPRHLSFFALNYKVGFVPIPLKSPMGKVESGIAVFSEYNPAEVSRYSYPSEEKWPMRLFTLNRCFMTLRYPLSNGKQLVIINTHNSAFDNGSQRRAELDSLKSFLLTEEAKGNYLIVGGDWNHNPPHYASTGVGTKWFKPMVIDSTFMPNGWQWVYDASMPSNRYVNEPYREEQTQTTLLDFFLCSPNIECLNVQTHPLHFTHTDHNPVTISVVLKTKL